MQGSPRANALVVSPTLLELLGLLIVVVTSVGCQNVALTGGALSIRGNSNVRRRVVASPSSASAGGEQVPQLPMTTPSSMLSELEVKSDHELQKSIQRTTVATKVYGGGPEGSPAQTAAGISPTPYSHTFPYRHLQQPSHAFVKPPSQVQPLLGASLGSALSPMGINLYAFADPTSIQRPTSGSSSNPQPSQQQQQPLYPAATRNASSEQHEQLGCGWDLVSQSCKDVFQIGWCNQCADFGNVFLHDCKCTTVTALYANAAAALASVAASAATTHASAALAANGSDRLSSVQQQPQLPLLHPPQLANVVAPQTQTTPFVPRSSYGGVQTPPQHQLIVVPVPIPVPVVAQAAPIQYYSLQQHQQSSNPSSQSTQPEFLSPRVTSQHQATATGYARSPIAAAPPPQQTGPIHLPSQLDWESTPPQKRPYTTLHANQSRTKFPGYGPLVSLRK